MSQTSAESRAIIFNPNAKGSKARRFEEEIRQFTPPGTRFMETHARGDARKLARQAAREGAEVVIAAGGDGTVNEVVNGLMQARDLDGVANGPALGILPAGTVNVFALELGLPLNLRKAWRLIERGNLLTVDLGRANAHYFVQMAGVGLDAQVVRDTDLETRKTFGPLSYLFTAATVLGQEPPNLVVESPGLEPLSGAFVLVGNGRFYGGPFEIFKGARLDSGYLQVLVIQNLSWQDAFRYLRSAAFGVHDQLDDVHVLTVTECLVRSDRDEAGHHPPHSELDGDSPDEDSVPAELDGEIVGATPVKFTIRPGALRVCVPG